MFLVVSHFYADGVPIVSFNLLLIGLNISIPQYCMYVCMVITYSKSKDQPRKVANPARGQLNRGGKKNVLVRAGKFGLVKRVRQSRSASACSSIYPG